MQPFNRRRSLSDILNDLAETVEQPQDEAGCEEARDVLADYIALELDGGNASETYPAVAQHLLICPSCIQHYQSLREMLLPTEEPVIRPPQPFDLSLLPPPQTLSLAPHDVVPPPPQPAAQPPPLTAWLRAQPVRLQALRARATHAGQRGSTGPSSPPESAYAYERAIQDLGEQGKIEFTPTLEGGQARFLGRLHPWEHLRGKRLRVYSLTSDPELQLSLVQEVAIGAMGRIRISDLAPDTYILALVRENGEDLPLTLVNADEWDEEQPL